MYKKFDISDIKLTKYLFFTGKGGVGKTSTASAIAVALADQGKKIMLISTDPASNLQDVFEIKLDNKGVEIKSVPNLTVANFDPVIAAEEYKESVVGPFRGKLPEAVLKNMEEQLSGSCTVEIAAFNEFSSYITDKKAAEKYDHIIFDTAPTGHTLRMLQLPSAWTDFISESTHGASCLGQLAGLESKRQAYKEAVDTLADSKKTTLVLVSRPEASTLKEAERASIELNNIGVKNQALIINGVLEGKDDDLSNAIFEKQQKALKNMPDRFASTKSYFIPLKPYNITGIKNIRLFLTDEKARYEDERINIGSIPKLKKVIDDINKSGKKVIFTMGKGGVGKTTIAATIALGLAKEGKKVHLATTDPAAHLKQVLEESSSIKISSIDEKEELAKYKEEVLGKARETMSKEDIAYIEEDLRSPCTQEIAVFKAFAEIVDGSDYDVIVIDTAPTGHTLLLLDTTQSYDREIQRSKGDVPESVQKLLPRLKNGNETEVIIITLPETTPVYEAMRLEDDLKRAGIHSKWWVVNSSFYATETTNDILRVKANNEIEWINKVNEISKGNFAAISWSAKELTGDNLKQLFV